MSSAVSTLRRLSSNIRKNADQQMSDIQKFGHKIVLDRNIDSRTEMMLNTIAFLKDRRNNADAKIQYLDDIIMFNYQYFALPDNPKLGRLLGAWNKIMSGWAMLMDEQRVLFNDYVRVEFQEPVLLPSGQFQIMTHQLDLSPAAFTNMYLRYNDKSFQDSMRQQYDREMGFNVIKGLSVPSSKPVLNPNEVMKEAKDTMTPEERETWERIEYFGNVEVIHRGKTVLAWSYREKHTFPNTPIVMSGTVAAQKFGEGMVMPTGSMSAGLPTPPEKGMARKSTS